MISYFKVDVEKWENGWYNDFKIKSLFPLIDINKVYICVSILESDTTETILRVNIDDINNYHYYIPRELMIPIETIRDKAINQIIDED
jgi:hypothetical protein